MGGAEKNGKMGEKRNNTRWEKNGGEMREKWEEEKGRGKETGRKDRRDERKKRGEEDPF